jgi:uncharacterized protein
MTWSFLHKWIVRNGDNETVNERDFLSLLDLHGVDHVSSTGVTTLHLAMLFPGNMAMAVMLLEKGADVNKLDHNGSRPVHWACSTHSGIFLPLLHRYRADFATADHDGNTPLHYAAKSGNTQAVEYLLHTQIDLPLHQTNHLLQSPMAIALVEEERVCVRMLLQAGCEVTESEVFLTIRTGSSKSLASLVRNSNLKSWDVRRKSALVRFAVVDGKDQMAATLLHHLF